MKGVMENVRLVKNEKIMRTRRRVYLILGCSATKMSSHPLNSLHGLGKSIEEVGQCGYYFELYRKYLCWRLSPELGFVSPKHFGWASTVGSAQETPTHSSNLSGAADHPDGMYIAVRRICLVSMQPTRLASGE